MMMMMLMMMMDDGVGGGGGGVGAVVGRRGRIRCIMGDVQECE